MKETIFTPEAGARRGVPKVLVVLTDGRSQDDVNKVSKEMQMDGWYFIDQTQKKKHWLFTKVLKKMSTFMCFIDIHKISCVCWYSTGGWRTDPHSPFQFLDALCTVCHILQL